MKKFGNHMPASHHKEVGQLESRLLVDVVLDHQEFEGDITLAEGRVHDGRQKLEQWSFWMDGLSTTRHL